MRPFDWQRDALIDVMGVRADGLWAAQTAGLSVSRQNGKNGAAEIFELYVTSQLGMRVLHSAHEVKTARKAFKRLLDFYDNLRQYPELRELVSEVRRTNGQEAIELVNGGSVEFVARTKSSGRGFSVDVLLMDEAQELTEEELESMQSTNSASANPMTFLMGTPPKRDKPATVWRRIRKAGVDGVDPELCWIEYSAAPDDDFRSREVQAKANPGAPESISWRAIDNEFRNLSLEGFAAERLGVWFDSVTPNGAFDRDQWASLADPDAERGNQPCFAVATAPDRSWSAVAVAWKRPDGNTQVMLARYAESTAWVSGYLDELQAKYGGTVVDRASHGLVEGADAPSGDAQAVAHNAFSDAVVAGTVRHGNEAALNVAVHSARWRAVGDTRVLDRKGDKDISPVVAAALAVHGLSTVKRPGRFISF